MNKKGQEMTLGTIILIVLGVVVLVFLIFGFSMGWSNLWEKITGLGGGKVNVDTIKIACELACKQKSPYGFCTQVRNVVLEDESTGRGTCDQLAKNSPETHYVEFKRGNTLDTPYPKVVEECLNLCPAN